MLGTRPGRGALRADVAATPLLILLYEAGSAAIPLRILKYDADSAHHAGHYYPMGGLAVLPLCGLQ